MKKLIMFLILLSISFCPRAVAYPIEMLIYFYGVNTSLYCENMGYCVLTSTPINRGFLLKGGPDEWTYTNPHYISKREDLWTGLCDYAMGINITIRKEEDAHYITAVSMVESSYARYFSGIASKNIHEMQKIKTVNQITSCECSAWMGIPPWTAGVRGFCLVEILYCDPNDDHFINLRDFASVQNLKELTILQKYWLTIPYTVNLKDYAEVAQKNNLRELAILCEDWLK